MMNSSAGGKPVMGVQMMQIQNNSVLQQKGEQGQGVSTSSPPISSINVKPPVLITTTPPSPLVTAKQLPSASSVPNNTSTPSYKQPQPQAVSGSSAVAKSTSSTIITTSSPNTFSATTTTTSSSSSSTAISSSALAPINPISPTPVTSQSQTQKPEIASVTKPSPTTTTSAISTSVSPTVSKTSSTSNSTSFANSSPSTNTVPSSGQAKVSNSNSPTMSTAIASSATVSQGIVETNKGIGNFQGVATNGSGAGLIKHDTSGGMGMPNTITQTSISSSTVIGNASSSSVFPSMTTSMITTKENNNNDNYGNIKPNQKSEETKGNNTGSVNAADASKIPMPTSTEVKQQSANSTLISINNKNQDSQQTGTIKQSETSSPIINKEIIKMDNKAEEDKKDVKDNATSDGGKPSSFSLPPRPPVPLDRFGPEIGEDVRLLVTLLENAGLCGPIPSNNRPTTAGGRDIPPARPSTAERATFGSALVKSKEPDMEKTPTNINTGGAGDQAKEKEKTLTDNKDKGIPVVRPKTAMAATATVTVPTSGVAETNKTPKKESIPDTGSGTVRNISREGGTGVGGRIASSGAASQGGRNNNKSKGNVSPLLAFSAERPKTAAASRSRPSSTLYQHTASSAQKVHQSGSASVTNLGGQSGSGGSRTRPRTAFSGIKMGDSAASSSSGGAGDKPASFKDQFAAFSKFGDTSSDGKSITLSNSDKWMKQAKVVDAKKITTTDTSICFKKLFKTQKKVSIEEFKKYVEELAKSKKLEPQELLDKLTNCGTPGLHSAAAKAAAAQAGVVERLTDTSKYTGSHKERFDATGKGKGLEGRRDVVDGSGYVAAFKEKLELKDGGSKSPTPGKE